MSVIDVKTADFEAEVLKSDKTVLVDFWAVWCGPCRMLSPVVDQVAEENPNIKVCKVNVDEEQQLAIKYGVMSIPTLLVFKGGELVNQSVGVIPKEEVLNLIK
jgi:thioredoxin 1